MNIDAIVVQSVAEVDPEAWDVAGTDYPFSSYQWYAFCEKIMPDCSPAHILLFRDKCTFARGSFWLMRKDVLPIASLLNRKAGEWLMQRKPLLVCRSPIANVSGLALPLRGRREAFAALSEVAEAHAGKFSGSFVLYDYLNTQEVKLEHLPRRYSYAEVVEPGTALNLRWNSFEDFLSTLSKQAWKDYRRHSNQAAKLGIRISSHLSVDDIPEAVDLIRRVERFHGTAHNPWTEEILTHMYMVSGTWLEARQNDRLVGCGLLLRDGNHLVATLMGLDYDTKYAYFPFIYTAIQIAIEQGVQVFHAGSGAYEMKQRLGFVLEGNNHIAFTGIGSLFSRATRLFGYNNGKTNHIEVEESIRC
jgi:hypothetical protein